ncbi:MAG: Gfo/Idh/MocA family oxidoreductase [Ktedonobacteraceae bacterium]|nr:Gfo/Idh/MocA family oxidoreductase [Ktedonobacteraceae bacterium]
MALPIIHVGLGGWGSSWAATIVAKNKNVETVAWVEIDAKTLQQVQQRLDLPEDRCFTSLEEALAATQAEAVLITASLPGHVPSTKAALQAGKHVLLEKPFAPSVAEAQELVELAEERGKILMISQNYRYAPVVRTATKLIQEQAIGNVGIVNVDFRRYDNIRPFEEHRHYKIWEPLLVDMSIHHFDLMRLVIGQEPLQVMCKTWNPSWSKYVEPAAGVMTITFDGGAVVSYRGNWVSMEPQTNWTGDWHMEGEKGELVWSCRGDQPEYVTLRPLGESASDIELPEFAGIDRAGSLAAFVQAVQTNTEPETSGRHNLKTLALMFAAIESAKTGLPVNIA